MTGSIPYYTVKKGRGFWEPSDRLKKLGFASVPCGIDGPEAREIARTWAERAKDHKPVAPYLDKSRGYVYFLCCGDRVKVGFTKNLTARMGDLATGLAKGPSALVAVAGTRMDEQKVLRRLDAYRLNGEWLVGSEPVRKLIMRCLALQKVDIEGPESKQMLESIPKNDGHTSRKENEATENA